MKVLYKKKFTWKTWPLDDFESKYERMIREYQNEFYTPYRLPTSTAPSATESGVAQRLRQADEYKRYMDRVKKQHFYLGDT